MDYARAPEEPPTTEKRPTSVEVVLRCITAIFTYFLTKSGEHPNTVFKKHLETMVPTLHQDRVRIEFMDLLSTPVQSRQKFIDELLKGKVILYALNVTEEEIFGLSPLALYVIQCLMEAFPTDGALLKRELGTSVSLSEWPEQTRSHWMVTVTILMLAEMANAEYANISLKKVSPRMLSYYKFSSGNGQELLELPYDKVESLLPKLLELGDPQVTKLIDEELSKK